MPCGGLITKMPAAIKRIDVVQAAARIDIIAVMRGWSHWRTGSLAEYSCLGSDHVTSVGRCMADMPSTDCTLCHGSGRVQGSKYGSSMKFLPCPRCEATGKIDAEPSEGRVSTRKCSKCRGRGETINTSIARREQADAGGYCGKCGTTTGEPHHDDCELAIVYRATCFRCRGSGRIEDRKLVVNPAFISATDGGSEPDDDPRYMIVDRMVCEFKRSARDLYMVVAAEYMTATPPVWLDAAKYRLLLVIAHDKIAEALLEGHG